MNGLGSRLAEFKPMLANVVAGFILGSLTLILATAIIRYPLVVADQADWNLPYWSSTGLNWGAFALAMGAGFAIGLVGIGFWRSARMLVGYRVIVHENGFHRRLKGRWEVVLWTDLYHVRETITHERPPILEYPARLLLPKVASRSFTAYALDGGQYTFDGDDIRAIDGFGRLLRERAAMASLNWDVVEDHR